MLDAVFYKFHYQSRCDTIDSASKLNRMIGQKKEKHLRLSN